MEKGIEVFYRDVEVVKMPLSDGGEGFVESLVAATQDQKKFWLTVPWEEKS